MRQRAIARKGDLRAGLVATAAGLLLVVAFGTGALGDRIRLRGGGEIRGMIVPDPTKPEVVQVQTANAVNLITFPRADVIEVIVEDDAFDAYEARRDSVPETAQDQYDFGLWCAEQRLPGLAEIHYRRAVELDKNFGPAHKKLGHVEHEGVWMTYDEQRAALGLVKHQGRWIAREEMQRIEDKAGRRAEHESWVRQVRVLRQALASGPGSGSTEAAAGLAAIRDPVAVPALVEVLGSDPEPWVRQRLVDHLATIAGPEAMTALVGRAIVEEVAAIRQGAVAALAGRADRPEAIRALVERLASKEAKIVGRAAEALAGLDAQEALPALIDVLVRVERRPALVRTVRPAGGPVAGGLSVMTGQSLPVLTGPTVAPGVVAFGATSTPYVTSGVGLGGGAGPPRLEPGPPAMRVITRVHRNADVHNALVTMTGRDFSYDTKAWKRWLTSTASSPSEPARRVLQPLSP